MDATEKEIFKQIANTIRQLSIEAVQKANSGHPGLPLGCADIAAYLYGKVLRHHPKNPKWINRDRFVLSAGHGSMLLYSCLYLAGFGLEKEELMNFRQLHSRTPGHPEYGETPGVESTTGPLGQGIGNAIGQALAIKILEQTYNRKESTLFDAKVFCLAGDGCLMEGVSQEACSFAGHLGIDNFVLIFDSNHVTLDGPLSDSGSDDIAMRFRSYGFDVYEMNGHDLVEIDATFTKALKNQTKPVLIIAHTTIGYGSPNKAGTCKAHGSPLGEEELALTKKALGLSSEPFFVPQEVTQFFSKKLVEDKKREEEWKKIYAAYEKNYPVEFEKLKEMQTQALPKNIEQILQSLVIKGPTSLRAASQEVICELANHLPYLIGGSADLSESDRTHIKQSPNITKGHFNAKNIKYGIREFAMATIASGIFQSQLFVPFIGTFLTFSDYMRNAIRLACLGHYHVIYQFTHDSVFLGEDGPTHQPVEQVMSLRLIPNIHVIRPADPNEVKAAWYAALTYKQGPTALILTRQNVPDLKGTAVPFSEGLMRGAYVCKKEQGELKVTILATGSEVSLAIEVSEALEKQGVATRVISMPCMELFRKQDKAYQEQVLSPKKGIKVSIEAGVTHGFQEWVGQDGLTIGIDRFGISAPMKAIQKEFGFTVENIVRQITAKV
jgi:transketolase